MKYAIALLLLFGFHSLSAQTELLNHKSHSGTNKNFKVTKGTGNFGIVSSMHKELEKDNNSSYKLIVVDDNLYSTNYVLFKTKNKAQVNSMYTGEDEVIESISISTSSKAFRDSVEKLLTQELRKYRKLEKP